MIFLGPAAPAASASGRLPEISGQPPGILPVIGGGGPRVEALGERGGGGGEPRSTPFQPSGREKLREDAGSRETRECGSTRGGAAGRTGSVRVGGSGTVGVLGGGAAGPGVRTRQPLLGHGRSPSLARVKWP